MDFLVQHGQKDFSVITGENLMCMQVAALTDAAKKKIIVALDVPDIFAAQKLVGPLAPNVGMFKVGKELFTATGPVIVEYIKDCGGEVFLDLKYHDIPNTVAMAGLAAAKLGVKMFNLHALGGPEMMTAAVTALHAEYPDAERRPKILAVTILTSSTESTLNSVGIFHPIPGLVKSLAKLAQSCGVDGVVCSPQEVEMIREACGPDFLIVTPGIRPLDANANDQKRIATPGAAIVAGSDYLVIGRPIINQHDPVAAAKLIAEEIAAFLRLSK